MTDKFHEELQILIEKLSTDLATLDTKISNLQRD
jgi:hypothetical protein